MGGNTTATNYTLFFAGARYTNPPAYGTYGTRFNANVGITGSMIFDATGVMYAGSESGVVKIDTDGTITSLVTPAQLLSMPGVPSTATKWGFTNLAFGANNTLVVGTNAPGTDLPL
jgi:hypothetical protein